jgi:hypothetical protein
MGCALAGLLGLAGFEVELVEREADGSSTVHVAAAAGTVACCPGCGTASGWVMEVVGHTVRHLVVVPLGVTWRKRRMTCENTGCRRGGFVEDTPLAVPGGRVSVAALETMGHLVGDWMVPVSRVAGVLGASWHTAHGGFVPDVLGLVAEADAIAASVDAPPAAVQDYLDGKARVLVRAGRGDEARSVLTDVQINFERLPPEVSDDTDSWFGWSERALHLGESYTYSHLGDWTSGCRR